MSLLAILIASLVLLAAVAILGVRWLAAERKRRDANRFRPFMIRQIIKGSKFHNL